MKTTTTERPRSADYVEIPDWALPIRPDVAGFLSAIALAGLEGGWFRLRATTQRALLGRAPFGACAIKSDGNSIEVFRSVCFGTDGEWMTLSHERLAEKISAGELCRPGIYGRIKK